ncbi:eukaryotic translation initiation factor subunit eIF-4F [Peziza echinospora]|nr:eukaryotic translation initiation factor subunit eIF-4F [Peziza echinospora]
MTSLASNSNNPATLNPAPATPSNTPANTQSTSGQQSTTIAAATAASRATPNPVSYAAATKKPSPPIVSSNTAPIPVSGAQGPNARTSNASPVNGKPQVAPAVPGVSVVVNGATGPPNGHSRKSSIVSGGNNAWNGIPQAPRQQQSSGGGQIQFGSFPGTQSAQAPLGGAQISSPNLAAPALPHPRVSSPQMSPSPLPQPAVSGGPITHQGIREQGNITFGSLTASGPERVDQRQMHGNNARPAAMPIPPVAPAAQGQSHTRRESASSHHPELPQGMGPNRGGMQNQGGRRGGPQYGSQYNAQSQGFNNHNYNRGQQGGRGGYHHQNMNNQGHYPNVPNQMVYPGSPQQRPLPPRSPAMHHTLPHSQPGTPQLSSIPMVNSPSFAHASVYQTPPQHVNIPIPAPLPFNPYQHLSPEALGQPALSREDLSYRLWHDLTATQQQHFPAPPPAYDPSMQFPTYYMHQPPYNTGAPASPRNPYLAMGAPMPYVPPYAAPPPMSRSASGATSDIRGPPSAGFMPQQPPHMPATPPANISQPPVNKRASKAIQIFHPETGAPVSLKGDSKPRPVVSSTSGPVIVSSGPIPTARTPAVATGGKSDEEKRKSMALQVQKKKEEDEALERAAQQKKKDEEERLKREAEEAEEKKRKEEEEEKLRKEAEEKARIEEERLRKEKEEADRIAKEKAEEEARIAKEKAEEEARIAKEKAEEEARIAKEKAEEAARIEKEKAEEEARIAKEKEEAEKKAQEEAEAKAKAEAAEAAAAKAAEEAAPKVETETAAEPASEQPEAAKSSTEDAMRPPQSKTKAKPLPLVLKTSTEPGPPSAALTALRSARFIGDINSIQYPANILSPNPALNPGAPAGKFKYHKDFLLQFQEVFKDKPYQDWDQRIKDTVGDPTDSARPMTARLATGSLGPRGSRTGGSSAAQPIGAMGSFGSGGAGGAKFGSGVGLPANMLTSQQRFEQSSGGRGLASANPLQSLVSQVSTFRSSGVPISRTSSSAGLSSQSSAVPSSPRTGNRSQRGSKRGPGGAPMEKSESKQAEPKPVLTIPVSEVKPLVVSEKRWQPRSVTAAASTGAAPGVASLVAPPIPTEDNKLSPEIVQRKVKAALNKMTPEKFEKISQQILDIASQSKYETDGRTLRQVIQLTFEKATDEAAWSSMYAKFCKAMMENMDPNIKDEGITDLKTGKVVTGGSLFRKYLLNRCQEEFQRGWKVNLPPKPEGDDEAAMLSDEYYIAAAAKRRGLGLIQFIGELFKLSMLTERIMHECVKKLVDFEGVPEEAEVESLCKLLRTIGSSLDSTDKGKPAMDAYFTRITRMIDHPELNSRLKFMLMDIVDLRSKNWNGNEVDKGPKTIAEIRQDAEKAQAEKQALSHANSQRGGRSMGGRGDGRSFSTGGYGNQANQDYQRQSNLLDSNDLKRLGQKNRNTSSGQNFGPSTMFSRTGSNPLKKMGPPSFQRGGDDSGPSSRSATPASGQREPTTISKNSFHLLADHSGDGDANESVSPAPSAASSPPTAKATLAMKPLTGKGDQN